MRKVELSVMRPWIANKVSSLLGFEDEVVIEYVNGLLEDHDNPVCPALCLFSPLWISLTNLPWYIDRLWTRKRCKFR